MGKQDIQYDIQKQLLYLMYRIALRSWEISNTCYVFGLKNVMKILIIRGTDVVTYEIWLCIGSFLRSKA